MANWISGFEARTNGAVKVTYGSVGSGAGIAQITARTVDFGASDAPLTPEQAAACNGCVQIPWALSGVGIGYNIPGVKPGKLKLTGKIVASIYLGKITKWNDPKIKKLNPRVHLPGMTITPVFRSDGSGDDLRVHQLPRRRSARRARAASATRPRSASRTGSGGKGNSGVTSVVQATKGSIGYIAGLLPRRRGPRRRRHAEQGREFRLPEPGEHRRSGVLGEARAAEQRDPNRDAAEEVQECVPDLDVHLLHRPPRGAEEGRTRTVHQLQPDARRRNTARRSTSASCRRSSSKRRTTRSPASKRKPAAGGAAATRPAQGSGALCRSFLLAADGGGRF